MKRKKIIAEYCPKCKDVKMVRLKSGQIEIFECKNCKFKVKRKWKKINPKKKEEK